MKGKVLSEAEVDIVAFRAIDEPELCKLFAEGHRKVLEGIGVTKVTSADLDWANNPATFVTLCMDKKDGKAYGGARVQVCGGNQSLPFIDGVVLKDPSVPKKVEELKPDGTCELCGLWNSKEVAGMGIGAIYTIRAAVAIMDQLKLETSLALCSPLGARLAMRFGYYRRKDIGSEGTFYYPKEDLIATMVQLDDIVNLPDTPDEERQKILDIRANHKLIVDEENRGKKLRIHYDMKLNHVDYSVFDHDINQK